MDVLLQGSVVAPVRSDEEAFGELDLVKFPPTLLLAGTCTVYSQGQQITLARPYLGFAPGAIDSFSGIESTRVFLSVENLTTFHELTRDTLGVLVLVGFSFLGKFDANNLRALLESAELQLLLRCLSIYLIVSFVMQWTTHWRAASLAYKESLRWLSVLQRYTSKSDSRSNFLDPLDARRGTLWIALAVSGAMYVALAFAGWNLPKIAQSLLL